VPRPIALVSMVGMTRYLRVEIPNTKVIMHLYNAGKGENVLYSEA